MLTAKRPALRRFWIIDRELRKRQFPTAEDLAALAEVDVKTIRRDIESLRNDHHAPIAFNSSRRGWEYTQETYYLPAVVMTEGELVAMFLAGHALRQVQGTPYAEELRRAIEKLSDFLPSEVTVHWQALDQLQSFHQTVTTLHDLDIFRQLADAVLHRRQLRMRYWTASRDAETTRTIDPWHLACIDGTFYLMAWCHTRRATRMFSPGRIRELTETGESFQVPDDFQIGDFFDGTFKVVSDTSVPLQTVRLKFAPGAARYIREKIWHVSQKLEKLPNDSVVLELSLRSLIEVRRWILSWGSECEVLAPTELRADIQREAAAILRRVTEIPQRNSGVSSLEAYQSRQQRRQRKPNKTG